MISELLVAAEDLLRESLGPERRIYLPFVGSSLALAAFTWWRRPPAERSRKRLPGLLRYLFPWGLFRHASARLDVHWVVARSLGHALVGYPLRITALSVALALCGALRGSLGRSPLPCPEDRSLVVLAFTACLLVADDLTRYLLHRAMHEVPALWELHKVHHSAEVLTPLTLYRVHPVESAANQLRGALATGLVTGLFMWGLPGRLAALDVLGVDALGFVWTALGANLRHSHVWLGFPTPLERWFVSPAQHQLHHARDLPPSNYGSALAVWDRLFGTLLLSGGHAPPRVGLRRSERNHDQRIWSMVVDPLCAALRRARPAVARKLRPPQLT